MNALQLLLADDLPTLPLYFRPNVTAASNKLVNWKPESDRAQSRIPAIDA